MNDWKPGDWLTEARAPRGLLEASRQSPPPTQLSRLGPYAAAAAALVIGVGLGRTVLAPAPSASEPAVRPVQLVYTSPEATRVEVAGSFSDWQRTPMVQTSTGVFTIILELEPGEYEYQFVVDGQDWVTDPLAVHTRSDGFGSENAVLTL